MTSACAVQGVKDGILLEAGFDRVAPNQPCLISSWAYGKAAASDLAGLTDSVLSRIFRYAVATTRADATRPAICAGR